jgi:DNA-binding beta-propeller fold protein YncE
MQRSVSRILVAIVILTSTIVLLPAARQRTPSGVNLQAPAGNRPTKIDPAGETVLPNGRLLTPVGRQVKVAPHPYGLALSPDGKTLVTANSGTNPFSVSIITDLGSDQPKVVQIPPGFKSADADPETVFMGVAIAPDDRTLYLSEGDNGRVGIFDVKTHERLDSLSLDGEFGGASYKNSLPGELKLSADGRQLYVLDLAHFRLVVIDTEAKRIISSTPLGRLPFALALSPDGRRAYVTHVGMFRYSIIPGYDPKDPRDTGLDFAAFGLPSKEAAEGTTVGGKQIPGLGDPNVPESNSLWVMDISDPAKPSVTAKIPTGLPVGAESVGGSSPGAVVAGRKRIYVSNAAQDSITIVNARSSRVEKTVVLEPAESVRGLRGVLPFGMALSPDESVLVVACAGINALALIDVERAKVIGYLPTAWFPARVACWNLSRIYVSCAKGFGAGPNGGPDFQVGPEGTYIGDITAGIVSIISLPMVVTVDGPADSTSHESPLYLPPVRKGTRTVLRNNGFASPSKPPMRSAEFPVPPGGKGSGKIKHVVFIIKENRTFDEVFGDIPETAGERVNAEPTLARYGEDATVKEKDQPSVEHARVTPNHHALARRFALSDNFYVDSDVSVDGHHWLVGNYPNELIEAYWPAAYGDGFDYQLDPDAPGRYMLRSDAPRPESYLQAGSLWEHLARNGITFRNYGEGTDVPGAEDGAGLHPTGLRHALNMPLSKPLFENTSRAYPAFNMLISDQYRFGQFESEFRVRYLVNGTPLPQFISIWLPNDHTDKPRPEDGYAYRASYVADNDLALGKLVELFSHSPFWKDMAIVVIEDDAQDGRDHVDAHRSVLMVISPYARRGVSHVHTSMGSVLKTFFRILGLPPLNQYDATATDLADMFTAKPDFTPYTALPSDTRIFDPAKVREPGLDLHAEPGRRSAPLDDPATIRREHRRQLEQEDND